MTTADQRRQALVKKIESIRKGRGTTKRHIYTAAGMSQVTYDRKLAGDSDFTFIELINISEALGVTVSELTEDEDDNSHRAA